jgi:hypothetical protein
MDKNGSATTLETGFGLSYIPGTFEFTANGIKLLGSRQIISSWELIPNDNCKFKLTTEDGSVVIAKVLFLDIIPLTTIKGNVLVIPNKSVTSLKTMILVTRREGVKLLIKEEETSIVKETPQKELFIDMINYRVIQSEERLTEEAEEQIEKLLDMQKVLTKDSIEGNSQEDINFVKGELEIIKQENEKYLTQEEIEYLCQNEDNFNLGNNSNFTSE